MAPEEVAEAQRRRILRAMFEVAAERGYPETRVVDVIEAAGVSRRTFYELYADKEDCFLAAYGLGMKVLYEGTLAAFEERPQAPWAERLRLGLAAFLRIMADRPAASKFCIVEVLAAGPRALARRDAAVRQFTAFIDAGRSEAERELPGITALSLAGGVNELLYSEIASEGSAGLVARLPEMVYWITLPFLGAKRAASERERARELAARDGA